MLADRGRTSELAVATSAHQIRLIAKFQGCWIRSGIVAVRIMAGSAADFGFLETSRAFQRFNYERCLAKPSVFVKTLTRELAEWLPQAVPKKLSRRKVVQFAIGPRIADRRLHVALRANRHKFPAVDFMEIHRWVQRLLRMVVMLAHF